LDSVDNSPLRSELPPLTIGSTTTATRSYSFIKVQGGRFFVIKMGDFSLLKLNPERAQVVDFLMLKWVIFLD
jgi:hypothetical protein